MRFYLRDLFWVTTAIAIGFGCWLVGYRLGCEYGRMEVNLALQRSGKYAIFRIDDNGKHFVFDKGVWVQVPDPPSPPPPPPPPPSTPSPIPANAAVRKAEDGLLEFADRTFKTCMHCHDKSLKPLIYVGDTELPKLIIDNKRCGESMSDEAERQAIDPIRKLYEFKSPARESISISPNGLIWPTRD